MPRFTLPKPAQTFTGDDAALRNACTRFIVMDNAIQASALYLMALSAKSAMHGGMRWKRSST